MTDRVKKIGGLWAIDECAKRTGVPHHTVTAWLRGEYDDVDPDDLTPTQIESIMLLEAYDVTVAPKPGEVRTEADYRRDYQKRYGRRAWS
jgi:hypothetical protein